MEKLIDKPSAGTHTPEAAEAAFDLLLSTEIESDMEIDMAADLKQDKTIVVKSIKTDDIKIRAEFNVRSKLGDVGALIESIDAVGLQTPITVKTNKNGFQLVAGFRRMEAVRLLRADAAEQGQKDPFPKVSAKILSIKTPAKRQMLENVMENTARESLNPMDEAHAAQKLIDVGYTRDEVRYALTWSSTMLTQRLHLLGYSDVVKEGVETGYVTVNQARQIATLPEEMHADFCERAADLPVKKLAELVKKALDKINGVEETSPAPEPSSAPELAGPAEEVQPMPVSGNIGEIKGLLGDIATDIIDRAWVDRGDTEPNEDERTMLALTEEVFEGTSWEFLPRKELEALKAVLEALAAQAHCVGLSGRLVSEEDEKPVLSLVTEVPEDDEDYDEEEDEDEAGDDDDE